MSTILHTEYSDGWGGQEMRIVKEAAALASRGHRLLIAARPQCQILDHARRNGLATFTLAMRGSIDPVALARLVALIRREHVDILNTHSSIDAWIGGMAARVAGIALVRTRHVSKRVRAHRFNAVHRWPAMTVTTGETLRQRFIEDVGAPPERVVSVPTGIDLDRFTPPEPHAGGALRTRLGLPEGARIVATVAVLRRAKRHALLLEVAARLRHRMDVHFVFAGEGSQRAPLEHQIEQLGLQRRVHLLGHVDDVRPVLAAADVVASASAGMEGVPQALAQALAMTRPVVATDDGAVSELIREGVTGLLVEREQPIALAAAIERLLDDEPLARACGQRGREWVSARYSEEAMATAMADIYRRVLLAPPQQFP